MLDVFTEVNTVLEIKINSLLSAAGYLKDKIGFPRMSVQRVVFF